jgi:flagellar basal-body rod modification protein FlgD
MSTSSILSSASTSSTSTSSSSDAMTSLGSDDFLKLFLAELQNQDPLDPTNTSDLLNQISQIKSIAANEELSDTLTGLQLQQQLFTGNSLLKSTVTGKTDAGQMITGQVDSISIEDKAVKVNVGGQSISLKNITKITPS